MVEDPHGWHGNTADGGHGILGGEEELLRVFSGARFDGVVPSWADLVAVQIERVEFGV